TPDQIEALTRYADALGLMFQVTDDLLDVTSDAAAMGKATQKDAAAGKLTYPGLMGVDGARAEVERLRDTALSAIEPLGEPAGPLRQLAQDLSVRRK
ncbi:MAG: polyprenyl synthetase family protein, partial [Planctomycetota bacterium]